MRFRTPQTAAHPARWLAAVVLAAVLAGAPGVQAQDNPTFTLRWQKPATGSPVVTYLIQIENVETDSTYNYSMPAVPGDTQTFIFLDAEWVYGYRARVAGVDAQGRQGPWSDWSPVHSEEGQPIPEP